MYILEGSTNLLNWTSLSTNAATGYATEIIDPTNFGMEKRFYRVRQVMP